MARTKSDLGDCRFYEAEFPSDGESVMVKVEKIESLGAYVSLLEYNNLEGMILMTELSKVRFRSVNRLIKVGRLEVVMVLRVDPQKGYIDLSKKRVSPEDIVKCEERYSKAKKVNQTIRHVAQSLHMRVDELNAKVTWPLEKQFGSAHDALKEASQNSENVFSNLDISDEIKESILHDIKIRFAPQALKLRAKIDVWCFGYDGIEAIKASLEKAKEYSTPEVFIIVKLIAPPQYVVVSTCYDKAKGLEIMKEALALIQKTIKSYKGGEFKQQEEITLMGGEEEKRLEQLLIDHEEEEDDNEEEDEGMGRVTENDLFENHTDSMDKRINDDE